MRLSVRLAIITTVGIAWLLYACGGSKSDSNTNSSLTQGVFAVELVDAPSTDVTQIVVTVREVTAHSNEAGWVTLFTGSRTIDLLTLQSSTWPIGSVTLPKGQVTQIRLVLADGPQYVTLADGSKADLKVPSGEQSGIKIDGPFEIEGCSTTTVTLDFDGKNSIFVHPTGSSQEWILRPVIKVKGERKEASDCPGNGDAGTPGPNGDAGTPGGGDAGTPDGDGGTPLPVLPDGGPPPLH